mgnify:CR=1 FL=1
MSKVPRLWYTAMRETAQGRPHRIQNAVPHSVGDQIPPQDPCRGSRQILADQAAGGSKKYYPDWHFTEIGIDKDHVHVHMVIPPKYSVSFAVETIKKNTSRALREKFRFLEKVYWDRGGIWSKGYFVSTVGISEEIIRRYVARQGKEDAGQAQLEF